MTLLKQVLYAFHFFIFMLLINSNIYGMLALTLVGKYLVLQILKWLDFIDDNLKPDYSLKKIVHIKIITFIILFIVLSFVSKMVVLIFYILLLIFNRETISELLEYESLKTFIEQHDDKSLENHIEKVKTYYSITEKYYLRSEIEQSFEKCFYDSPIRVFCDKMLIYELEKNVEIVSRNIITYLDDKCYERNTSKDVLSFATMINRFTKNYFLNFNIDRILTIEGRISSLVKYLSRHNLLKKNFIFNCCDMHYEMCSFTHAVEYGPEYIRFGFDTIRLRELKLEQTMIYAVLKSTRKSTPRILALQIYFNHLTKYILSQELKNKYYFES